MRRFVKSEMLIVNPIRKKFANRTKLTTKPIRKSFLRNCGLPAPKKLAH
jgi:hypothetical protein